MTEAETFLGSHLAEYRRRCRGRSNTTQRDASYWMETALQKACVSCHVHNTSMNMTLHTDYSFADGSYIRADANTSISNDKYKAHKPT